MRCAFKAFLVSWLCFSLALSGCSPQRPRVRIAVIPKGTTHQFWQSIRAGALKAAQERGDVEIVWDGPNNEGDKQGQQNIVERFISEGVSAIVLAPCDRRTLVVPVTMA